MKYQVYKKPNGTEELRLKPESEKDCDEIDNCSQCYFENEDACEDESGIDDFMEMLGFEPLDSSLVLSKEPGMSHRPREPTFEEMLEKSGLLKSLSEVSASRAPGHMTIMDVRTFAIKDGKVIADPETRRLMNQLGIIEKIERSIREEEDEN